MVTSYYIMKINKSNKNVEVDEYFDNLSKDNNIVNITQRFNSQQTCRVCLKEGLLPIFGNQNTPDIIEALSIFGDVEVNKREEYPNKLCKICFKFLKGAILFRKLAKHTNELLKQPLKLEPENQDVPETSNVDEDMHSLNDKKQIILPKLEKDKRNLKVQCYVCNRIVNRSYYKEHMTMHDPDHKKYVCDICGKSFRLRCAYHNHSLRHRNDFPFKCQFCPYKGRYAELLKTHMHTHTKDYRYMCTECPARFLFKSNLNSHILLKHKEPQFKCDACKRAFHTKLTLRRHFEADHLGIRNHVCNVCGKAFGYRNAMMKHQRHVHKREKFMYSRMPAYLQAESKNNNTV
ncbi:zinc finger protein 81-like [Danaus plexippus]|uniref:zinc finger protein 81-like n=1 Tax=Danaus plexippus TaxID=13037 RepID=UPI002AAF3B71|nr:zinc finger protein 81-like [Danaus plexippus]